MQQALRVLYVDDDQDIRTIVTISLDGTPGIELETAASGQQALEKALRFAPHLILLDVMMPGMDGPTTLRHLRAHAALASVPVAFVTAKVQPGEIDELMQAGAVAVISKPFNPVALPEQIHRLLQAQHHD